VAPASPLVFWTNWGDSVQALRAGWADQQRSREQALARATAASPSVARSGPATIVLVISDSINRDNMALYGYGRADDAAAVGAQEQLEDQMLVLRNAWSVDASTLPALRNLFNFGLPQNEDPQHVIALARTAGYKVWWISNHDDVAIEQAACTPGGRGRDDQPHSWPGERFAGRRVARLRAGSAGGAGCAQADRRASHGRAPALQPEVPAGDNPFDDEIDAVEAGLAKQGRSAWVRRFRQEYDAAVLYQDFVVSETLRLARSVGDPNDYRAWMYLSDHARKSGTRAIARGTVLPRRRAIASRPSSGETIRGTRFRSARQAGRSVPTGQAG